MIQNKTSEDRTVTGNLVGEDIKMGVADMGHLLNVVTDLYADRELAPIREYATNGVDAHIEAGVTAPIEVSTPTHLAPFLTIRDFGIGLSLEDIRTIYSQYGASTKRNTNDQTGMLGLGCKSALTYADQFTVTSVKDGVRIQVVVSRNSSGASMKVVDSSDSSEPNGTSVTIPARANNQIERKAKDFFRFWRPGTVKLNGAEPEFMPEAKWVSEDICIIDGHQSYLVMGNVPYPVDIPHGLGYGQAIVAFVPIGAVDFAPSREALMDTDTTTATKQRVLTEFKNSLAKAIQKDIEDAGSPREAIDRRMAWRSKVPSSYIPTSLTYKGKVLPNEQALPKDTIVAPMHGSRMAAHSKMDKSIPVQNVLKAVWVTGWDHASFTATTKKKLLKFIEDDDKIDSYDIGSFILSMDEPSKDWIDGIPFVKWADVKSIKLPRNAPNPTTGRIPGSYDIWEDGDYNEGVPGDDIDTTNKVFWTFGAGWGGRSVAQYLAKSYPGSTLVMLRSGREGKFQRNFPQATEATDIVKADYEAWKAKIDKYDAVAYAAKNSYHLSDLDYYDAAKCDDPDIKLAIQTRGRDVSKLEAEIREWQALGFYYQGGDDEIKSPLEKYPLLPSGYTLRRGNMTHVYRYMNAEYAFLKARADEKAAALKAAGK